MKKIIEKIMLFALINGAVLATTTAPRHNFLQTKPGRFALTSGLVGVGSLAGAAYLHKKEKYRRLRNLLYVLSALGLGGSVLGAERAHRGTFETPNFDSKPVEIEYASRAEVFLRGVFKPVKQHSTWGCVTGTYNSATARTDTKEGLTAVVRADLNSILQGDSEQAKRVCERWSTDPRFVGAGCIIMRPRLDTQKSHNFRVYNFKSSHSVQYGVKKDYFGELTTQYSFPSENYDFIVSVVRDKKMDGTAQNKLLGELFNFAKKDSYTDDELKKWSEGTWKKITGSPLFSPIIVTRTHPRAM